MIDQNRSIEVYDPAPGNVSNGPRFVDRLGGIFSDFVSVIAPGISLRMDYARQMRGFARGMMQRGYDAGKTTRFTKNKAVSNGNANQELLFNNALSNMRKYTREICRNSPIAKSIKNALSAHIIGTGVTLQAGATDSKGNPLDEFNNTIERDWRIWEKQCDVVGKKSFSQFLSQGINQLSEGGEYIVNKVSIKRPGDIIDLKLEAIENELLDETFNTENIIGGVEVNEYGMPIAYHFLKGNTSIYNPINHGDRRRVLAENIIHLFIEERPGQLRGTPWFHPCLVLIQTAHRAIEAELYTLEIQACLSVLHTSGSGNKSKFLGAQDSATDDNGNRIDKLAPGLIARLPSSDNITVVDPKRPGNTFAPFIDKIIQYAAASLGISYSKVAKDYSKGNFSSERMGDQDDRRHLKPIQRFIDDGLINSVYESFVRAEIVNGRVKAPDFERNKEFYLQKKFTFQPYDYIQPLDDARADQQRLDSKLVTFKDMLSEEGKDWRDHFKQLAKEREGAKELGIVLYQSGLKVVNVGGAIMETVAENPPANNMANDGGV